ncbi:glycoside hydrolase domain-containing protein [Cellulomonas citrea]|uniref:glycoside hydrolase domain-containing protein n=1 Tax=Cellulomonas citrea TaxID=1909423 RepID=UPI001356ECD5|nr:glycoside hydrolase domain-containing protein [Cellulomonas citrea]
MSDVQVVKAQQWVNRTYSGVSGYTPVVEDGITGWRTVWALTRGLQHELGITALSDNFGTTTESTFTALVGSIDSTTSRPNVVRILRCALWCKGYTGGDVTKGTFDDALAAACVSVKTDIGLASPSAAITAKIMKALLTMDAYVTSLLYGGTSVVRSAQQWLNSTYLSRRDFYVVPCDGVFSRDVQKALMLAIQYELGMADGVANGTFGPGTQIGLRASAVVKVGSKDTTTRFVRLFQAALVFNGYPVSLDGVFADGTKQQVLAFQSFAVLATTGNGDYQTWASLLVSTGDPDRICTVADTSTPLDALKARALVTAGYGVVGRYLSVEGKRIGAAEIPLIHKAGLRLFTVYQESNNEAKWFTYDIGFSQGWHAQLRARQLGIKPGATIWFPVDFDATEDDIATLVVPYFNGVNAGLNRAKGGEFTVGVYGARHVCQRVCDYGLATTPWVSGIPRGWSGNLGFPLPAAWAFDQIATVSVGTGAGLVTIDKNVVSTRAKSLGPSDVVPVPTISKADGTATFHPYFTPLTQLTYEAETYVEASPLEPVVRPVLNDFVLHQLQRAVYWDPQWIAYTPLPETVASAVGSLSPMVQTAAAAVSLARDLFYVNATATCPASSYEGDIPHFAATARSYTTWGNPGSPDTTGVGDLGGWALDLVTFWADYVDARQTDSTLRVPAYCAKFLGVDGVGSRFGGKDLISDMDAYLAFRRMDGTRRIDDIVREILVNCQSDPRWRFRAFFAGRFNNSAATARAAVTHLFKSDFTVWVSLPVMAKIGGRRKPGEVVSGGPTGQELADELPQLASAFATVIQP